MSLLKVNEVQNYNGSSLTLTASTVSTSAQLNTGGNISVTGSINVSDDSTTRSNLGLGTMATQNANAVAITGGTINTVQPATGQSLTIKDEDGNTAITVGTDNTATDYLSLNFGSYHGGSGTLSGNTLSDYEAGTWSPAMSSGSVTISDANYIKIGTQVYLQAYLLDITDSSTNADIYINNLPFTSSNSQSAVGSLIIRYTKIPSSIGMNNVININPYISTSSTQMSLFISLNTPSTTPYNWQRLQYDQLAGVDWDMILNITYLTS